MPDPTGLLTDITLYLYRTYSHKFEHYAIGGFDDEEPEIQALWRQEAAGVIGYVTRSADALAKEQAVVEERKRIAKSLENLEVGEPGKWDFSPLSKAIARLKAGEELK